MATRSSEELATAPATEKNATLPPLPGWNEALLKNRAVQVITVGNKALICCKYEDLKNVSFRQHSSRYCAVPVCKNYRGKVPSLSFFQFPRDLERCKKWIGFCDRDDLRNKDAATLYRSGHSICAEHFEDCMFMNAGTRNRLIHCAVPTVFDPSHPPSTPSSIKELAAARSQESRDPVSPVESEVCPFHRKFLRSVTVLETDVDGIRFCMHCGSPIREKRRSSPTVYTLVCKKGHDSIVSVEFALGCRRWVTDHCQLDGSSAACRLCESHSTSLTPGGGSSTTIDTKNESNPSSSGTDTKSERVWPSLPGCFFSARSDVVATTHIRRMTDATQTEGRYVRPATERIVDARRRRELRREASRLRRRMAVLERRLQSPSRIGPERMSKELPRFLSGPFLRLVQERLKLRRRNPRVKRWSADVVTLARKIRAENAEAYAILRRLLPLPGIGVLRRHPVLSDDPPSSDRFSSEIVAPPDSGVTDDCPVVEMVEEEVTVVEATTDGEEIPVVVEEGEVGGLPGEAMAAPVHLVAAAGDDVHLYEVLAAAAAAASVHDGTDLVLVHASIAPEDSQTVPVEEAA